MRRSAVRLLGITAIMAGLMAAPAACGGGGGSVTEIAPTTFVAGGTESITYQLVCPSPLGDLSTTIQFTVTTSDTRVTRGQAVTYEISAPLAQVDAPITPTFVSSTTTYAIPAGLTVTSARMSPPENADFTSTSTDVGPGTVSFTLRGDFRLDGSPRSTPVLVVEATVDETAGPTIVWETPTSIVGDASVPILGTQDSSCTFPTAGPIGTTPVE